MAPPRLRRGLAISLLACLALFSFGCRKKSPDERLAEIDGLFEKRNLVSAVFKCRELIKDFPKDPVAHEARIRLAAYYYQTGDTDRSLEYLEQVYKGLGVAEPRGFASLIQALQLYREAENFQAGLEKVEWALKSIPHDSPTTGELLMAKADLLLAGKEPERGGDLFREIMLKSSSEMQRHQSRELLAQHYRSKKQWDKAIETYDAFIRAFPDSPIISELEVAKALAMMEQGGRNQEARDLFILSINDIMDQAEEILDAEQAASRWESIAQYYALAKMTDEAIGVYEKILADYPQAKSAQAAAIRYGDFLVRAGRLEDAKAMYNRVERDNPMTQIAAEAQRRIARLAEMQKRDQSSTGTLLRADAATSPAAAAAPKPPAATKK